MDMPIVSLPDPNPRHSSEIFINGCIYTLDPEENYSSFFNNTVVVDKIFTIAPETTPEENMLFNSQIEHLAHLNEALNEKCWREAYHVLANMGWEYEMPAELAQTGTEGNFREKKDTLLSNIGAIIRTHADARKNLLVWSRNEALGKTSGGLGKACFAPEQQAVIHKFLLGC